MKYQITINQAGVVASGLHKETDATDWIILNHIFGWQASTKAERMGDKVWISYANVMRELPLLGLNSKGAVANRIKKIKALGLIETEQTDDFRLFVKTTGKYERIAEYREGGSPDCTPVHSGERAVHEIEQGPVHDGEHSSFNYISPLNQDPKRSGPDGPGAEAPPTDLFGGKPTPPKQPDTLTEDARSQMWQMGVSLLTNQGLAESTARGLIGKWAKQGEKKLAGVIGECAVKPPADARAYINAAMQNAYNLYDEKQLQAAAKAYGVKIKQKDSWDSLRERVQDAMRGGVAA